MQRWSQANQSAFFKVLMERPRRRTLQALPIRGHKLVEIIQQIEIEYQRDLIGYILSWRLWVCTPS